MTPHTFAPKSLIVVSKQIATVRLSEIDELEARMGIAMPPGYADLLTTYGEGTVCNELNLWAPARIRASIDEARTMWAEDWFWEHPDLAQADFAAGVPVGDSANGDQLVLIPERGLVMLPRHSDDAIEVGASYTDAVHWFCTSGRLVAACSVLWFESWAPLRYYESWRGKGPSRVRDAVAAVDLHVAQDGLHSKVRTFLIPAIGGGVVVAETFGGDDVHVDVCFEPGCMPTYARIEAALLAVGAIRVSRWSSDPTERV
ncbi:hypothetical protein APR12_000987 [Nocardia amikacinitolerans]|uniref:SMI1/KNR4 family protein n=1 Tax=Nocardia amikacinitolerans TaxID=756689 RepID=UPI00083140DB|nr:SMI1/KNR4 family protein [Nocardia amikacinitolerans]MCP2315654.1 hypothetical protein [Nocardia amikacinitolerans]